MVGSAAPGGAAAEGRSRWLGGSAREI